MYICIDLKSFYASVECVERGLDPMKARLVVADPTRTEKTICLAVSPALKAMGIKNRCRLFEIPPGTDMIVATPRMQLYIDYSARIYGIYLKYIAKEDIHVYSIDEAFMDVTQYLKMYKMTAYELGKAIMDDIYNTLGIRATCGVGTNMYLTKVALDIVAKHAPDFIGELDEEKYIKTLWDHKPLSDFWRIGHRTEANLMKYGITTMREIAGADKKLLYKLFGVDAELLIDHAWGRESVTMADVKNYKTSSNSLSSGQILPKDYSFADGMLATKEMMDLLCLDMVRKNLITKSITLDIGFSRIYSEIPVRGSTTLDDATSADVLLIPAVSKLYEELVPRKASIRRIAISCNGVVKEEYHQYNFFTDPEITIKNRKIQQAVLNIKDRYGKNAILKGMNLEENARTRIRNTEIGGHKSGQ